MAQPVRTRGDVLADIGAIRAEKGEVRFAERAFRHAPEAADKPAPRASNGGPRVYDSPVAELADIGESLYAPDAWVPRLARDIGEDQRAVRKWISGERNVPPAALRRARIAIRKQIERLEKLLVRLGDDPRD